MYGYKHLSLVVSSMSYPRDLVGYGANPPHPKWQGDAKIALKIFVNYEEGSEYSIPDGDEVLRCPWL